MRGFNDLWFQGVENVRKGGIVAVKLTDTIGPYFQSSKGVRQGDPLSPIFFNLVAECLTTMVHKAQQSGLIQSSKGVRQEDPLSPILFNFVADCLTRMVHKAQQSGFIVGLIDNLIDNGVAILQYADDTIMCLKHDIIRARNLKVLLYVYEQMSALKINFEESDILVVGGDDEVA